MILLLSPAIELVSNLFTVPAWVLKYDYATDESFFWHNITVLQRKPKYLTSTQKVP